MTENISDFISNMQSYNITDDSIHFNHINTIEEIFPRHQFDCYMFFLNDKSLIENELYKINYINNKLIIQLSNEQYASGHNQFYCLIVTLKEYIITHNMNRKSHQYAVFFKLDYYNLDKEPIYATYITDNDNRCLHVTTIPFGFFSKFKENVIETIKHKRFIEKPLNVPEKTTTKSEVSEVTKIIKTTITTTNSKKPIIKTNTNNGTGGGHDYFYYGVLVCGLICTGIIIKKIIL